MGLLGISHLPTVGDLNELSSFRFQRMSAERASLFNRFLLVGGFPEAVGMLSRDMLVVEIQQYLVNSIISKILTKDLQKYFSLEFVDQDLSLFKILCAESGSAINYKRLSKDITLSEEKIAQHVKTFQKASLVRALQKFDPKLRKTIRAHPKVYAASPCLVFSYLGHTTIPTGSLIGHVVEG